MKEHAKESGFTLLEAVIAIAIFAIGGTALYGWISSNIKSMERIEAVTRAALSKRQALEFISSIDPVTNRTGSMNFGEIQMYWEISEPQYSAPVLEESGGPSIYDAEIYSTEILLKSGNIHIEKFSVYSIGFIKKRDISDVLFN